MKIDSSKIKSVQIDSSKIKSVQIDSSKIAVCPKCKLFCHLDEKDNHNCISAQAEVVRCIPRTYEENDKKFYFALAAFVVLAVATLFIVVGGL